MSETTPERRSRRTLLTDAAVVAGVTTLAVASPAAARTVPVQGATGPTGASGPAGPPGPRGATGSSGAAGSTGARGATGAQGSSGPTGAPGTNGAAGAVGPSGPLGAVGPTGSQGEPGNAGDFGTTGSKGATGAPAPSIYRSVIVRASYIDNVFTAISSLPGSSVTHQEAPSAVIVSLPAGTFPPLVQVFVQIWTGTGEVTSNAARQSIMWAGNGNDVGGFEATIGLSESSTVEIIISPAYDATVAG